MLKMKIYSDYIWPFCYIGNGIVEKLEREFELEKEWLGLEIHPETPPGGRDMNAEFPPEMRRQLYDRLNTQGKEYGISFKSGGLLSNTHLALILSEYAKANGHLDGLHKKLFKAYFEEGKDIGDRQILLQIAEEAGLSREEVEKSWQDPVWEERLQQVSAVAFKQGATGVPTFIINDKHRIVGAQPYVEFQKILRNIEDEGNEWVDHSE